MPSPRLFATTRIDRLRAGHRAVRARLLGVTLVEAALAIAIVGILTAIAIPSYSEYVERSRIAQATADIQLVDLAMARWETTNNTSGLPDTLAELGGAPLDPWGRPYQYLNLRDPANLNDARKDHNLHPINTDYDLYSMGPDGRSVKPLTGGPSRDDIIRARNGRFVGKATDF